MTVARLDPVKDLVRLLDASASVRVHGPKPGWWSSATDPSAPASRSGRGGPTSRDRSS